MAYTPSAPLPSSPKVRELGMRLSELIQDFQRQHPNMSAGEVRQAIRYAATRVSGGRSSSTAVAVGAASAAGFGVLGAIVATQSEASPRFVVLAGIIAVGIVAVGLAALRRNR